MRKLFLVLACLVVLGSFGLAQSIPIVIVKGDVVPKDIYIPVPIEPLPEVPHASVSPIPGPRFSSSHGPGKNYSEHLVHCAAHREYSFSTKQWKNIPALSRQACTELWGKYLLTKQKIGYQPLAGTPLWSTK